MAWVSVDENGTEAIFTNKPERLIYETYCTEDEWYDRHGMYVNLPSGSIEKLIGRKLTWEDEPVEVKQTEKTQHASNCIKHAVNQQREQLLAFCDHLNTYDGMEEIRFDFMMQDFIDKANNCG